MGTFNGQWDYTHPDGLVEALTRAEFVEWRGWCHKWGLGNEDDLHYFLGDSLAMN